MMKFRLFILVLAAASTLASHAQFIVEKRDGSTIQLDGNVTFTQDPVSGNWSVGDQYDEQLQLDMLNGIRLAGESPADPFANKTCWVYGVKAPEFPGRENLQILKMGNLMNFPAGTWGRFDYQETGIDYEKQFQSWADTCGWYDCNKTYDIDGAEDSNMCWAASTSNLLHWWLVMNADYIARYDEVYGQPYEYARPSAQFLPPIKNNWASNKSEIFKFFISTFHNKAGWSGSGVNWFINGNSKNISAPFKDPSMAQTFTGFFSKVFSKSDTIATDSKDMTKENFNVLIKKAFSENKAIGVVVYDIVGKNTGPHALTIWGAEFDSEGYVSHIYYVENNGADQDPSGAALYRFEIAYINDPNDYSDSELTYFRQLPKPFGGNQSSYLVTALILVDLRRDIWETTIAN